MSLSIFLNNTEEDIVLEAANDELIKSSIRDGVKNIIDKIKKFITKVINWIKTKVYDFLKIDNVSISKEKYNDCMYILNKLDKIKNKESLDDLKDSREYKNMWFNDDSMMVIKTDKLKSEVRSLNEALTKLNNGVNHLDPEEIQNKQFQIEFITTKMNVINVIINGAKIINPFQKK